MTKNNPAPGNGLGLPNYAIDRIGKIITMSRKSMIMDDLSTFMDMAAAPTTEETEEVARNNAGNTEAMVTSQPEHGFTMEEYTACDWTEVDIGPNGVFYRSGKTGKVIQEPVGTPFEQITEMRRKAAKGKGPKT